MRTPRVYILIVTYNAVEWIDFSFSNFSALPEGWKLVAVDNASTDGTVAALRKRYPQSVIIESGENLGFGRANNLGLSMALREGAEYVFLLNQDASASVTTIEKLVRIHREHPEYAIISPIHLNGDGTDFDWPFFSCCAPHICPEMFLDALNGALRDLYMTKRANAAAWLLSGNALRDVGGFNPFFYHYGEDDEYIHRIHFHGYAVGIAPKAYMTHGRKQKTSSRPPDYRFIRELSEYLDPSSRRPSLMRLLWRGVPAVLEGALQGRRTASRHYYTVLSRVMWAWLTGVDVRAETQKKGNAFLSVKDIMTNINMVFM